MTKPVPREPTREMLTAAWPIYNDEMTARNIWRAMWDAAPAAQAEPTADDARDAARYRWLRDGFIRFGDDYLRANWELMIIGGPVYRWRLKDGPPPTIDAAIDAAMRADK